MSLAGVLLGLNDVGRGDLPILGVCVSDRSPEELLDRRAPGWRKTVTLVAPTSKYEKPATATTCTWRGIRLDPFYEAKVALHVRAGDLFWVIACRAT